MDTPGLDVSAPTTPDLRAEVLGTLLLFLFAILVTAGVALCANLVVHAVG